MNCFNTSRSRSSRVLPNAQLILQPAISNLTQTIKFTSNGIFTCPAGVTTVALLIVAGGGGGGGDTGGGGGAGGVLWRPALNVTPGTAYNIVIGNGGARDVKTLY